MCFTACSGGTSVEPVEVIKSIKKAFIPKKEGEMLKVCISNLEGRKNKPKVLFKRVTNCSGLKQQYCAH